MQPVAHPVDEQHQGRVAFTHGPVTLVGRGHGHLMRRSGGLAQSMVQSMIRQGPDLQFQLAGITFVPFFAMCFEQPYQMYFDLEA